MKSKIGKITTCALVVLAFLFLVLLIRPAVSIPRSDAREARTLQNELIAAQYGCSGDVYFVDSGVGGTTGKDWANATATIDAAINLCTANNGDLILVAAGHNEAATAVNTFDADVAGIKIVGLGVGAAKPTIDYDDTDSLCNVGAANVVIDNIRFRYSTSATLSGILIEPAGDNCVIRNCDFGWAESAGDEIYEAILVSLADGCVIEGCTFQAQEYQAMAAITVASADGIIIQDNDIHGDYSIACISGKATASDKVIIRRNLIYNGHMKGDGGIGAVAAIKLVDDTAGMISQNDIVSDVATALLMRVADDMVFMRNYVADQDGDEFAGGPEEWNGQSITSHIDG